MIVSLLLIGCKHHSGVDTSVIRQPEDTDTPVGDSAALERLSGEMPVEVLLQQDAATELGSAVAVGGDLCGDGSVSILVGALGAETVWLLGAGEPLALEGPGAGGSLALPGDLDSDGLDDAIIGGVGAVWLVAGPVTAARLLDAPWHTDAAGDDRMSVAAGGDLTGDGQPDLLLGAARADAAASDGGQVWVVPASAAPGTIEDAAVASLSGATARGYAGYALDGAGDVDGDGLDDVIVGAWGVQGFAGAAYIVHGPLSGSHSLDDAQAWHGEVAWDVAGWSVAGTGDVDGDGLGDVLIGAYGTDGAGFSAGGAYLVTGDGDGDGGSLSAAHATLLGTAADQQAGWSVAGAGDLDRDGFADVLIGAPGASGGVGAAWLRYGPLSGVIEVDADATLTSSVPGGAAGTAVAAHDGEILLGAPGAGALLRLP